MTIGTGLLLAGSVSVNINTLVVTGNNMALYLFNAYLNNTPLPGAPAFPGASTATPNDLQPNGLYKNSAGPPDGWIEPNDKGELPVPGALKSGDPGFVPSFTWEQTKHNADYTLMKQWADWANAQAVGIVTFLNSAGYT